MDSNPIQHVFVLMLENRSFDHMLGFSALSGRDAVSGQSTLMNGLKGDESNLFDGKIYTVSPTADFAMRADPGHEFPDVLHQLCGPDAQYPHGGAYPAIDNSGYVDTYVRGGGTGSPGEVMKCHSPSHLPVLNKLAAEFVLCDNWHTAMPGPTWPNRFFVHAASSAGLDHSPSTEDILKWETIDGLRFPKGTIFDALEKKGISRRLYAGDDFPLVAALKGIGLDDIRPYHLFGEDLAQPAYPFSYTFIEPSYNVLGDYKFSTSQHPLSDVTRGEALIKSVYETIRQSAIWNDSLLIITWDEHGGFYDHAIPPAAVAPGDTSPGAAQSEFGFTFAQYGPRVPAVVISPRIPQNLIDHRLYDHSSILATLEARFGLDPLTRRDAAANHLLSLVSMATPRDTPKTLPEPAESGLGGRNLPLFDPLAAATATAESLAGRLSRPHDPVAPGNIPGVLHAALQHELLAVGPAARDQIMRQFGAIQTRTDALQFLDQVRGRRGGAANAAGQA
jgi:phospholipase C